MLRSPGLDGDLNESGRHVENKEDLARCAGTPFYPVGLYLFSFENTTVKSECASSVCVQQELTN